MQQRKLHLLLGKYIFLSFHCWLEFLDRFLTDAARILLAAANTCTASQPDACATLDNIEPVEEVNMEPIEEDNVGPVEGGMDR